MIGLVASLLAGIVLKKWIFGLAVIPYLLRLRGRNPSLIAFYLYVLVVVLSLPSHSIYTHRGFVLAVVSSTSVFLLLDEILGGIRWDRTELVMTAVLLVSALHDYLLVFALIGAAVYVTHLHFGRAVYRLVGWLSLSLGLLYLLRDRLKDPGAQTLFLLGLGLVFLLLAERNDVDFLEVGLFEEE
ncbi:hypothetical protein [Thermococcus sp.]|uniref:hypothetical protein n=1 Tax=Thermococcus sp. TaxID=35749 RepID=UPI0026382DB7|nr:hypothetical protein [Thermococcus sp.]